KPQPLRLIFENDLSHSASTVVPGFLLFE
ncbi:unnamed protein product, partial [Rotaria socialis]